MTKNIAVKIEKLFEYFDSYERNKLSFPFLRDKTRDSSYYSYDKKRKVIICHSCDISDHNGDPYNRETKEYPISEVGEKVYEALIEQAMGKAEEEYDRIQEEVERKKKIKAVKNYLNSKILDQSVAFIMEE